MNNHYRALCALMLVGIAMTADTLCFADEPVAAPGQLDFPGQSLAVPLTGPGMHPKVVVDMGDGDNHFNVPHVTAAQRAALLPEPST